MPSIHKRSKSEPNHQCTPSSNVINPIPHPTKTGPNPHTPYHPSFVQLGQHKSGNHARRASVSSIPQTLTSTFPSHSNSVPHRYYPSSTVSAQDLTCGGKLVIDGTLFKDAFGRTVQMRGVNLSGSSKLPSTLHADNPEHQEFFDTHNVSFINRPFPLNEAHEHLARLACWGLTLVRLLVPWEAFEHQGPGLYDNEYITYLIELIKLMAQYGIKCFIDPHQDIWSRFSGGSGAPGWTFEVAGMDIRKFKVTGASHVHNAHASGLCDCTINPVTGVYTPLPNIEKKGTHSELPHQLMLWPSNYNKLASATMFTLFFAGATFAPTRMIGKENIQHYLQRHYFNAYKHLATKLKHLNNVIGFDVMNEPHQGYVGVRDMAKFDPSEVLLLGDSPSALQSFLLGEGIEQEVEVWERSWPMPSKKVSTRTMNTEHERVWLPGYTCPWLKENVYCKCSGKVLVPDYFLVHPVTRIPVDFNQDFYLPFVQMYADAIQSANPALLVIAEPVPQELPPVFLKPIKHLVYSPHWYEVKTNYSKSFNGLITHDVPTIRLSKSILSIIRSTYFGLSGAKRNFTRQLRILKETGMVRVGNVPIIIGECGIPMDLNKRTAYDSGDYTHHTNFLDAIISALESNLLHFTLWNYNPGNDNTHGDFWNGEDFSIFSPQPFAKYEIKSEEQRIRRQKKIKAGLLVQIPPPKISSGPQKHHFVQRRKPSTELKKKILRNESETGSENEKVPLLHEYHHNTKQGSQTLSPLSPISATSPFDITDIFFNNDIYHHTGGRVLDAVVRPYAVRIAGTPTSMVFDFKSLKFRLEMTGHPIQIYSDPKTAVYTKWLKNQVPDECYETVIYVPKYHYEFESIVVRVSDGQWAYFKNEQTLVWKINKTQVARKYWIQIEVKQKDKMKPRNALWCCSQTMEWIKDLCFG